MTNSSCAAIVGLTGKYAGAQIALKPGDEVVFGRDPNYCNVVFDQFSTGVSRRHCSIRFNSQEDSYYVTDQSKNGTFTGDDRRLIPNMPVSLPRGAVIYLGNKKDSFRLD